MIRPLLLFMCSAAVAADWSKPVEIRNDTELCVSYRARLAGDHLVIEATHHNGWHTTAMDNIVRANEKLAGRKALGQDRPTEIALTSGLESAGPWLQTPPLDKSQPDLRIYTWQFDKRALFAAKVRRTGPSPATVGVKGQVCSEATCKTFDISLTVPFDAQPATPALDLTQLIPVRTK